MGEVSGGDTGVLGRFITCNFAVQVGPDVIERLADTDRRGKVNLPLHGREKMVEGYAQPRVEMLVVVDTSCNVASHATALFDSGVRADIRYYTSTVDSRSRRRSGFRG